MKLLKRITKYGYALMISGIILIGNSVNVNASTLIQFEEGIEEHDVVQPINGLNLFQNWLYSSPLSDPAKGMGVTPVMEMGLNGRPAIIKVAKEENTFDFHSLKLYCVPALDDTKNTQIVFEGYKSGTKKYGKIIPIQASIDEQGQCDFEFLEIDELKVYADKNEWYWLDDLNITLHLVNNKPVANASNFSTDEDIACDGQLSGSDGDGDSLKYYKVADPGHGTVVVNENGSYTYTPTAGYDGPDSFTFKVNDGKADSAPATVSITVNNVNKVPVANVAIFSTDEDIACDGQLSGSDGDNDSLKYYKVADPGHGTVVVNENGSYTYTPTAGYDGPDSFTFKVNDGKADSAPATVSITVNNVNKVPVATASNFSTNEDTPANGQLSGSEGDGDSLKYYKVADPGHGTVVVNENGSYTYTPTAGYDGPDSFTFKVNDGKADSAPATVSITVNNVNKVPVATASNFSTNEDIACDGQLSGSDGDGDSLKYYKVADPGHGTVVVNENGSYTYTPTAGYDGPDSFTFKVNDGKADSAPATVSITVNNVNKVPVATASNFSTNEDIACDGQLSGSDGDGDSLKYYKVADPGHGTVVVNENGSYTYTPIPGYDGSDSFTFKVNDGKVDSIPATVSIQVKQVNRPNNAPVTTGSSITINQDSSYSGILDATDADGDSLSYHKVTDASNGTVVVNENGTYTYTPAAGYLGVDSFIFKANDGKADSNESTVNITVSETPLTDAQIVQLDKNALAISYAVNDSAISITQNVSLPTTGQNGTVITWASHNTSIMTSSGAVTRPAYVTGDVDLILTATITKGISSDTKQFILKVIKNASSDNGSGSSSSGSSGGSGGGGGSGKPTNPPQGGVDVWVNGERQENTATEKITQEGTKTAITITLDEKKLQERLEKETNPIITVPVSQESDTLTWELNGQMVKNMEAKGVVVEVKTEKASYILPAAQINMDAISNQVGESVSLQDIKVHIQIKQTNNEGVQIIEQAASNNNYTVVVRPIDFEISCTYNDKKINVQQFNAYVERRIVIPEGVDPTKITTGVVLGEDGSVLHVPTKVIQESGSYYAELNSITNSTYSVIWNPKTMEDVEKHWSKVEVNDMASRLVIKGIDDTHFEPNKEMTRAEFAMIITKALGLHKHNKDISLEDIQKDEWYEETVKTVCEYDIVTGYADGSFGGTNNITREEAMTMLTRAMKLTKVSDQLSEEQIKELLSQFQDSEAVGNWAENAVAVCIANEIVKGDNSKLSPKANITRAEAAAIVRRLLIKAELINNSQQ